MMLNYLKALCKHFIFAFIFTVFLIVFSYVLLSKIAVNNQQYDQEFINQVIQGATSSLPLSDKAKLLTKSQLFSYIQITNSQNILIDTYHDKTALELPFQTLTHMYYIDDLKIEYRHNDSHLYHSLCQLLLGAFLCAWVSFFFASLIHKARVERLKLAYKTHTRLTHKRKHKRKNRQKEHEKNNEAQPFDEQSNTHTVVEHNISNDIDSLTLLKNRNAFVEYFTQSIDTQTPEKFNMIAIARCSELKTINQLQGFHEGDNYIVHVANIMKATIEALDNGQLFRLNSSDFACLIPDISKENAESFATMLTKGFNKYQSSSEIDSVAYTGIVLFSEPTPLGELLALSDTGISIAQTQSINACHFYQVNQSDQDTTINHRNWRQEIDNVLENQRVKLLLQPITPNGTNTKIYQEVLARFINNQNEILPTASFISMAEKLDKISALDRMIIEKTMTDIQAHQLQQQLFGINISSRTINDEYFVIWLERRLLREPEIACCLIFEITESGLQHNIKSSKRFIDMVHRTGARITVERFGVDLTSFKFFKELNPDFIKMDSTYTRGIDEDKNNQYFLGLMIDLAHRLNIKVLAESVENKQELMTLNQLFIDGCQGFHLGKPQPMIASEDE